MERGTSKEQTRGFFEVKAPEEIQREIGRNPTDVRGTETDYPRYIGRVASIVCYMACGGFLWNLLDRCYSDRTHQPRVIGEGSQPLPGVDHLTSLHIITATVDEITQEPLKSQKFINRYYQMFDDQNQIYSIWSLPESLEYVGKYYPAQVHVRMLAQIKKNFDAHAESILDQLCQDAASRHMRADRGRSNIEWIGIGLSAFTAVIGAVGSYLGNPTTTDASKIKANTKKLADISYTQIFIGVAIATIIKGLSKDVQMHSKAAQNLDVTLTWVKSEIDRLRERLVKLQQPHLDRLAANGHFIECGISPVLLIEDKLSDMKYTWLRMSGHQNTLFESIAKLRRRLGHKATSAESVEEDLGAYRSEASKNVDPVGSMVPAEVTLFEALATLYGAVIFLVTEEVTASNSHCQMFGSEAPVLVKAEDDRKKEDEEANLLIRTMYHPPCHMILYTTGNGQYQPIVAPYTASFHEIKKQLMHLVPTQHTNEVTHDETSNSSLLKPSKLSSSSSSSASASVSSNSDSDSTSLKVPKAKSSSSSRKDPKSSSGSDKPPHSTMEVSSTLTL